MTPEARRAELEAQLAAIPDDGQLPASTTRDELAVTQHRRATLKRRLSDLNAAVAAVASLGSAAEDEQWRDHLTAWRKTLSDERMEIKSPIRDSRIKGREINLSLSIRCIDRGLDMLVQNSGYDLTTLRLGELMRASGYEVRDADPQRAYLGRLPWHGSLDEVEHRITTLAARRARAEADLAAALLSDDERTAREAEWQARRDALNAMNVRNNAVGVPTAYDSNGEAIPVEQMTPLQREALALLT